MQFQVFVVQVGYMKIAVWQPSCIGWANNIFYVLYLCLFNIVKKNFFNIHAEEEGNEEKSVERLNSFNER